MTDEQLAHEHRVAAQKLLDLTDHLEARGISVTGFSAVDVTVCSDTRRVRIADLQYTRTVPVEPRP